MIRLKGGNGPTLRAGQKSDLNGSVTHDLVTIQTAGGTTEDVAVADANIRSYTGATYHREGSLLIEGLGSPEIINLDPSVGAVASDGNLSRLSPGVMRLRIKTPFVTLPLDIDMRDKTDEPDQPNQFLSTVVGSLAEHCQQQVDSRIANILPLHQNGPPSMPKNGPVFTTQDHTTPNYVRNQELWCADMDLTCISPWNSNGGVRKAGVLVTPRHVVNASHYEYNVGNTVRFVEEDGTAHDRVITGKKRHPNYAPYSPDLTLYTLSSDLPAAITPCKLMPANWNQYLVQNFFNRPPALGLDQEEKALIIDFHTNGSFLTPVDVSRLIFHENKISGDSGNPAFLIVNGELVLVTVWTFGGAGSGTPVASHIADLNQMIIDADTQAGVSTGYTVTEADFSSFPNYA